MPVATGHGIVVGPAKYLGPNSNQDNGPSAPSNLAVTTNLFVSGKLDLTWTDNSNDETAFSIEQSANGTSGWVEVATPAANATSASITGLSNATTYYFRIRANRSGTYGAYSSVANGKTVTVTAAPWTLNYHLTQDGSGGLTYDSVDYSRDMVHYATVASFRAMEWVAESTAVDYAIAFDNANNLYSEQLFELLNASGTWSVRESNVQKATGSYVAGDSFRLILDNNVVKYAKNGVLVYTSVADPTGKTSQVKLAMHNDPASQKIVTSSNKITFV